MKKIMIPFALVMLTLTPFEVGWSQSSKPAKKFLLTPKLNPRFEGGNKMKGWVVQPVKRAHVAKLKKANSFKEATEWFSKYRKKAGYHSIIMTSQRRACAPHEMMTVYYHFYEKEKMVFFFTKCDDELAGTYYFSLKAFERKYSKDIHTWIDEGIYKHGMLILVLANALEIARVDHPYKSNKRLESMLEWYFKHFFTVAYAQQYMKLMQMKKNGDDLKFFCRKIGIRYFQERIYYSRAAASDLKRAIKKLPILKKRRGGAIMEIDGFYTAYKSYITLITSYINLHLLRGDVSPANLNLICPGRPKRKKIVSILSAANATKYIFYVRLLNKFGFPSWLQEQAIPVGPFNSNKDSGDKPSPKPPKPPKNLPKGDGYPPVKNYIFSAIVTFFLAISLIVIGSWFYAYRYYVLTFGLPLSLYCYYLSYKWYPLVVASGQMKIAILTAAWFVDGTLLVAIVTKAFFSKPKPEEVANPLFDQVISYLARIDQKINLWQDCLTDSHRQDVRLARELIEEAHEQSIQVTLNRLKEVWHTIVAHESELEQQAALQRKAAEYNKLQRKRSKPVQLSGSRQSSEELEAKIIAAMRMLSNTKLIEQFNDQLFAIRDLQEPQKNQELFKLLKEVKKHQ